MSKASAQRPLGTFCSVLSAPDAGTGCRQRPDKPTTEAILMTTTKKPPRRGSKPRERNKPPITPMSPEAELKRLMRQLKPEERDALPKLADLVGECTEVGVPPVVHVVEAAHDHEVVVGPSESLAGGVRTRTVTHEHDELAGVPSGDVVA